MSREVNGILHELEGILEKRAASEMSRDGGGYGDQSAGGTGSAKQHAMDTKGAGAPAEVSEGQGPDGAAGNQVNVTQRAGDKDKRYNVGMGGKGGNETAMHDSSNSSADHADDEVSGEYADNDLKSASMANNILRGLSALARQSTPGQSMKQAGSESAEEVIRRLIQTELQKASRATKVAMSPEDIAARWDAMSEEEREALRAEYPDAVEKAMALMNAAPEAAPAEEEGPEKMSAAEWAEYQYYKQAGAQAALQYIQQMQTPQVGAQEYELQKQAALQDYEYSKHLGRLAAERDIASLQKQAALSQQAGQEAASAAYRHPANSPDPQTAYDQMLKAASDAGINPDALHEMLTDVYRASQLNEGGTPHPFVSRGHVKSAVDVAPLYPVLSGLLDDGTISSEEKEAILNYLAGVEDLSEDALARAVEGTRDPRGILKRILAGDVQEHQRNTHKAESPKPAMPATQPSPSAESAEETRTVSEGGAEEDIPGSVEETAPNEEELLGPLVVEAALRNALRKLNPGKYQAL